ncbi:unnamed protein product, partial [marine sediment metagenome]
WEEDRGKNYEYNGITWERIFPAIDRVAHGGLVIIDVIHNEVHSEHLWSAPFYETLASGSASVLLLETPGSATATIHFIASFSSSGAGVLIFTEAPNATVGTVVTSYNHYRPRYGTAELSVTHSGAVTTTGTIFEPIAIGTAAPPIRIGGASGLHDEWVLDHSARYLLQFVCSAASIVAWNPLWYEEEEY